MYSNNYSVFPLATLAAALLAAYGSALAQVSDELTQLITPESSFSVGVGHLSKDAPQFGQYSGVRENGAYGLLDVDLVRRDEATGTWLKFSGQNLGLDSREFRISHERQGDWGYYLDYNQTPRYEPYKVTTSVIGVGSAELTMNGPSPYELQLKTKRETIGMGFSKKLGNGFGFEVSARNEEKNGARVFGRGPNFEFNPEPIDSTTRQLEARLNYSREKLSLSAAYYGTWYDNANKGLNTTFANGYASTAYNPQGLPPDNQSHQLSLAGNYSFSPTTHGTFKLARAIATQDDNFMTGVGTLAPAVEAAGRTNLGGRVETTLMQVGLTARPMPKLSLLANLRYEDRDDQTPVLRYATSAGPTSTYDGDNEPRSIKRTSGKLEASYQLPMSLRLTGGLDYEQKERNTSAIRAVSFRDKTEETSYRVELRRSMSDTLTGAVSYVYSDRTGSDFLDNVRFNLTSGINVVAPVHLADREREKLRLSLNWAPTEQLSVQFMADDMRDDYGQRTAHALGIRSGGASNFSIDAAYAFSDNWQATAWTSNNRSNTQQASAPNVLSTANANTAIANIWGSNESSKTNAVGVGLRAKISARISVGADLSHSEIKDKYQQYAIGTITVASLPDISTNLTSLKLQGNYTIDKRSSVRLDYVYDRYKSNDWTWSNFTYTDGTRLSQNPKQSVNFIGVSYVYSFQ